MRLLPEEQLVSMISELIYNSSNFIYTKFINSIRYDNTTILISPDVKDKKLLLKSIIRYLNFYTNKPSYMCDGIIQVLVKLYNQYNMTTIKYESIPFIDLLLYNITDTDLLHIREVEILSENDIELIQKYYKNKKILPSDILSLLKLQIFIMVSFYLDMDELLICLYNYYSLYNII